MFASTVNTKWLHMLLGELICFLYHIIPYFSSSEKFHHKGNVMAITIELHTHYITYGFDLLYFKLDLFLGHEWNLFQSLISFCHDPFIHCLWSFHKSHPFSVAEYETEIL